VVPQNKEKQLFITELGPGDFAAPRTIRV
jgi:hypothetical protein